MKSSLRIIFAGSGEFGLPALDALLRSGHTLTQIVAPPDRPAGRGRRIAPAAIASFALDHHLPLLRTPDINAEALPEADVLLVIAFGQKISPDLAARPRLGSLNLHASLLPRHRGASPIAAAILAGDTVTGNSVIRLAPRMDAGAVLAQATLPMDPRETAGELHDRLALHGAPLLLQTVADLAAGTAVERPQDDSQATQAPKLSRQSTLIDWTRPAAAIAAQIRALYPWPGCRVRLRSPDGRDLSHLTLVRATADPNGALEILEVQPEGGRPMSRADFLRGHPWPPGSTLESLV